jgi:hypothetical protein
MFDGQSGLKYDMWSIRIRTFLEAQRYDILYSFVTGYNATKKAKTTSKKELKKNKKIAMDFILEGIYDSIKDKVGKCSSTKELWDKLHDIYSSPIIESKNAKEGAGTEHEERCSSCQTDSKEEEYIINISMLFFFNCEKCIHLEIEFPEGNEIEKKIEIEDNYEA